MRSWPRTSKAFFTRHMKVWKKSDNTSTQEYKCDICSSTFNKKDIMKDHVNGKHGSSTDHYYMHILCCTSYKQIAWICVAHLRALCSEPFPQRFSDKFGIPISFCPGGSYCDAWNPLHALTSICYILHLLCRWILPV
jgi:hypothetical protein